MSHQRTRRPLVAPGATGHRIVIAGFLVFVVAALAIVVVRTNQPDPTSTVVAGQSNAELVTRGRQLYSTACATCHGDDLQGDPRWPQPLPNGTLPASPLHGRLGFTASRTYAKVTPVSHRTARSLAVGMRGPWVSR